MTKKLFVSLVIVTAIFTANPSLFAADAPKPAAKLKIEKLFPADVELETLWNAAVAVVTEKGLAEHPHGKMKAKLKLKKGRGKIKTPIYRYFKIYSAKPVIENHYRDSYKIALKIIETEKPLPVEPEAAKEGEAATPADAATESTDAAATPADPVANAGTEAAPVAAEGEIVAAPPEAPPAPAVEIIKNVRLTITRKFQVHNDETRKWGKADPDEHPVGYTVVYLLSAIEKQLAAGENTEKVEQANLNINPPVIVQ